MSAQPTAPATPPDHVNIEIDGRAMQVPKGAMIIHAADRANIPIPRFCYHDKLAIAANCRMCLVDVEKAPKPMPACATPVMEGMKVYTQSKRALDSQRNVMEFLLINHPLDCPICDQGGECELQDLAMGYGRSVSRFAERKRVVADEDLGSLVATDMTRCIQCTRCVRFVGEIAGTYELGGLNRGESLEIGTYIGKSLSSELSGNIVDVCPVGALTNKVFRYRARAWELIARESIAYHDPLGSNLHLHLRRGEVLRTVPRDNEAVNECWLSDRDRYSHEALRHDSRLLQPQVRDASGKLVTVGWDEAIAFVAKGLKLAVAEHGAEQVGALLSPMVSNEEGHLLARIVRALGSDNIDHRLRTQDFADHAAGATFEMPLAQVENAKTIVIVGGNPRLDQPLLGHRIRKAQRRGAQVFAINPVDFDFHFDLAGKRIAGPWQFAGELAALAAAAGVAGEGALGEVIADAAVGDAHRGIVDALRAAADRGVVVFGDFAVQHPLASQLRALAKQLARATGAAFNEIAAGANAVGLTQVGAVPQGKGLDAGAIVRGGRKIMLSHNVHPLDCAEPNALDRARRGAAFVVGFTAFACRSLTETAHAILPVGLTPEIDATLVNVDGIAQTVAAGAKLPGDARPGWKVLRALGAALGLPGFEFTEIAELRAQMDAAGVAPTAAHGHEPLTRRAAPEGITRIATVAVYGTDSVVRRAAALQRTPIARPASVALHPGDALALGLSDGVSAKVSDGSAEVVLPVVVTPAVPHGAAWIESGLGATRALKPCGAALTIVKA